MIRPVKLARINLTMESGTILRWLKHEGDEVRQDESLLEVESDKAVVTVTSFHAGWVKRLLVAEGAEVPVDTVIALVGDRDEVVPEGWMPPQAPVAAAPPASAPVAPVAPSDGITVSPLARRLAGELGVDLARVTGTGPGGLIGKDDVLAAARRAEHE